MLKLRVEVALTSLPPSNIKSVLTKIMSLLA